ncbi:protein FAM151B isoform X2 [Zootermopsis nevadensis]|uniref:protein FAM151B isoform X2 n=1 Tax=Zootermopsis nevadensis TaxID=136037 RepID=UPI000B8EC461|nr:protein FAM151B isoform X2 [Zootermopsis nevadensis]
MLLVGKMLVEKWLSGSYKTPVRGTSHRTAVLLARVWAAMAMSVQENFPGIDNDLTAVTWGHAVNSRVQLQDALTENLMMLEADVVLGTLEGGSGDHIPVMAHPPDNVSDLSLEGFLAEVVAANQKGHRCGIKLDFKTVEVLGPSLQQLQLLENQINFPVMLNADILPGPVDSTTKPVDADTFLDLCVSQFPNSTLSVGWTTRYGGLIFNGSYSEDQVGAMEEVLKRHRVQQPVTFPVRAGMAANSGAALARLKDSVANSTFTVWSSEYDAVNVKKLREVILSTLGRDRVFVDVPRSLWDKLELNPADVQRAASAAPLASMAALTLSMVTAILHKFK